MECLSKKIKLSIDFPRRKAHPFKKGCSHDEGILFYLLYSCSTPFSMISAYRSNP